MINSQYKEIARNLSEGPYASFLNSVIEGFHQKWSKERLIKGNEFDTLMAVAEREGRIKAFQMLQEEINRIAQEND